MTIGAKCGIWAGVLLVALLAGSALFVWRHPLAVYNWMNRRALARAGFVRQELATSAGRQVRWEAGRGPTLLLLHGAGDQAGTWADTAPRLAGRFHVVVADLPGHGESDPGTGPLSIGTLIEGLDGVLRGLPPGQMTIVGNSLGAWMALHLALRHPDRVERLVLVNGGSLKSDRPDFSFMPRNREEARRAAAELRDPSSSPIPGWMLDDVVREARDGAIGRLSQTSGEMERYLLDRRLRDLTVPVDLLWGESDKVFPPAYAKRMMAQLTASRLTLIPACGHVPQIECPTRFVAALTQVLDSAPAGK